MWHLRWSIVSWAVMGLAATAGAGTIERISFDLDGYGYLDTSGYRIDFQKKIAAAPGTVTVEELAVNPPGTPPAGFLLLDGTIRVTVTGLPPGNYRMMLQKRYLSSEVDRKGPVRRTLQLLRRRGGGVYLPARCLDGKRDTIRRTGAIRRAEFKRGLTAGGRSILGMRGVDTTNNYVWSVVDKASDFAVGGVPEPATAGLLLIGASALLLRRRRTA